MWNLQTPQMWWASPQKMDPQLSHTSSSVGFGAWSSQIRTDATGIGPEHSGQTPSITDASRCSIHTRFREYTSSGVRSNRPAAGSSSRLRRLAG